MQGADSVIYERLSAEGRRFADVTLDHLEEFGNQGLRTLCLAYRARRWHACGQLLAPASLLCAASAWELP